MKMTKIVIQAHISPYVMPRVCAKSLLPWITSLQSLSEKFLAFTIVSFTITILYHLIFLCSNFLFDAWHLPALLRFYGIHAGLVHRKIEKYLL